MLKRALMTVAVVGVLGVTGVSANAADVRIATLPGTGWLVTSTPQLGAAWTSVGFDASSWSEPTVLTGLEALWGGAPRIAPLVAGAPAARPMWSNGAAVDGSGEPNHIYMRNEFSLAGFSIGQALNSLAKIQVDDDFVFYVNGHEVLANKDNGFADIISTTSFGSYLHAGETNVFAIEAVDGGWSNPSDRSYQDVLFDALISSGPITSTVPEPASTVLVIAGLSSLVALRRRLGER